MSTAVAPLSPYAVFARPRPPRPQPLAPALLRDIAEGLAAAEDLWRPHAHHDPTGRRPVRLLAADRWEAWVIGWTAGQGVDLHDHGGSAGALVVVEGTLVEASPRSGRVVHTTLSAGSGLDLPPSTVHDVVAPGPQVATSIHVYSPPLSAMTYFGDDGQAHTVPVTEEAPVTDLRSVARALHPSASRA